MGLIFGGIITIAFQANAERVTYTAKEVVSEPEVLIEVKIDWTIERIQQEVFDVAEEYGVSGEEMWNTILCESNGSTTIQSKHIRPDGSRELSFGLVQIHLPAHPNVSYEEAIDPQFSIRFMAENFAKGKQRMWTCWRELY